MMKLNAFTKKEKTPMLLGVVLGAAAVLTVTAVSGPNPAPAAPPASESEVQAGIETLRTFSETFAAVSEKVRPAVVTLVVEKRATGWQSGLPQGHPWDSRDGSPFEGTPFEYFFSPRGRQPQPKVKGGGSGIIVASNGMILTNNHVVEDAESITVFLSDGREFQAEVQGTDTKTDLAVVKIDAKDLPSAVLGDSDATKVGEWVLAMGNPYGFDYTVTAGIISAKGRKVMGGQQYEDFIQTDASINPGNSGGPLLNLNGEVIGINTMIAGIGTGIGFAIPSNMAQQVAEQLVATGRVVRPWMGVLVQPLNADLTASLNLDNQKGALVSQVMENSPAEAAGLERYDVIVKVGDALIDSPDELIKTVLSHDVGDVISVTAIRDGRQKTFRIKTEALPDDEVASTSTHDQIENLGLALQELTPGMAEQLGIRTNDGVMVARVAPGSPAAEAGLRSRDVILEANRRPVASIKAFREQIDDAEGEFVLLLVSRDGQTLFRSLKLSK